MSNKFSLPWGVQKPPAVCKAPPIPFPLPPAPFNEQTFQGYAQWYEPVYGYALQISGPCTMTPNPPLKEHTGYVIGDPWKLELQMQENPNLPSIRLHLSLYFNVTLLGYKWIDLNPPQSLDPFDTGLVQFYVSTTKDQATARVWL